MASERYLKRRRAYASWRMLRRRAVCALLDKRPPHRVCASWLCDQTGFDAFVEDVGFPPTLQHFLLRRNPKLPWSGPNAYWSLDRSRMRTPARFTLTAFGHTLTIPQWARAVGVSPRLLRYRLSRYSPEEALSRPIKRNSVTLRRVGDALIEQILEFSTDQGNIT